MNNFHFSTTECFEKCPARFKYRYLEDLDTIPSDDPQNPLKLGTAVHRAMETDLQTAVHEYLFSYPVITNEHINEVIKIEYWIPRMKELLPEGLHEYNFKNDVYEGTADLLVPCTKHDLNVKNGQFDLYDFKYSNNQHLYMDSKQLHVYKHMIERITGKKIRKMFFVFVPKVMIRQKKDETIEQFRIRLNKALQEVDIEIKEVVFDPSKVSEFYETCMSIGLTHEFKKNVSYLCDWCEYNDYCQKGKDFMILPSAERRQVGQITKRKLWIYGGAFSGKTTFMDKAPAPLNLNTDGNIQFVTMQFIPIKDTMEGRQKVLAWKNFKDTIDELERTAGQNGFKTIIVDLLEDTYESCRLFMYDKLGITHESDDSFRAWDKVRTEFLSTIRRLMNLDYENIVLISHEDTSKDITKKSGDKITSIKPNIADKVANKVAGMVDIVARVVAEDDGTRTLNFKSDEVVFGGGRLKNIKTTTIPLDWDALCKVYDEANFFANGDEVNHQNEDKHAEEKPARRGRTKKQEETPAEPEEKLPFSEEERPDDSDEGQQIQQDQEQQEEEKPVRKRRTRKVR